MNESNEIGGETKNVIPKTGVSGVNNIDTPTSVYFDDSEFEAQLKKTRFDSGGVILQGAGEGQKLHSFDTKRPK